MMQSKIIPLSKEHTFYSKLSLLLLQYGTAAVREYFNQEFNPSCLWSELSRNQNQLSQLRLSAEQQENLSLKGNIHIMLTYSLQCTCYNVLPALIIMIKLIFKVSEKWLYNKIFFHKRGTKDTRRTVKLSKLALSMIHVNEAKVK